MLGQVLGIKKLQDWDAACPLVWRENKSGTCEQLGELSDWGNLGALEPIGGIWAWQWVQLEVCYVILCLLVQNTKPCVYFPF